MKKYLLHLLLSLAILIFFSVKMLGQTLNPDIIIDNTTADQRIKNYKDLKKRDVLNNLLPDKNEEEQIKINTEEYKKMIGEFSNTDLHFTGFRICFAKIKNLSSRNSKLRNKLTVVFVPTNNGGKKIEKNQRAYFYYLDYDKAANIATPIKTNGRTTTRKIQRQMNAYRRTRLKPLEKNAEVNVNLEENLTDFRETKSVFYKIDFLNHNDTYNKIYGLFYYLNNNPAINEIYINFAARKLDERYEHHLDILTELRSSRSAERISVGMNTADGLKMSAFKTLKDSVNNLKDNIKTLQNTLDSLGIKKGRNDVVDFEFDRIYAKINKAIKILTETYVDTGNPCPTKKCKDQ